jgi:hypothetical protein
MATSTMMQSMTKHLYVRNLTVRKRLLMTAIPPVASISPNNDFRASQSCRHLRQFSFLSPVFSNRLETMVSRHNDILKKIEDSPEDGYLHGKELASLSHAMILHEKKLELESEESSIHDLLEELGGGGGGDDDMTKECMEELERIKSSPSNHPHPGVVLLSIKNMTAV